MIFLIDANTFHLLSGLNNNPSVNFNSLVDKISTSETLISIHVIYELLVNESFGTNFVINFHKSMEHINYHRFLGMDGIERFVDLKKLDGQLESKVLNVVELKKNLDIYFSREYADLLSYSVNVVFDIIFQLFLFRHKIEPKDLNLIKNYYQNVMFRMRKRFQKCILDYMDKNLFNSKTLRTVLNEYFFRMFFLLIEDFIQSTDNNGIESNFENKLLLFSVRKWHNLIQQRIDEIMPIENFTTERKPIFDKQRLSSYFKGVSSKKIDNLIDIVLSKNEIMIKRDFEKAFYKRLIRKILAFDSGISTNDFSDILWLVSLSCIEEPAVHGITFDRNLLHIMSTSSNLTLNRSYFTVNNLFIKH